MKKKLLTGLMLTYGLILSAQGVVVNDYHINYIPSAFTADSKTKLETSTTDYGEYFMGTTEINIYDENLSKVTTLKLKSETYMYSQTTEREKIAVLVEKKIAEDYGAYPYEGTYKDFVNNADSMYIDTDGSDMYIMSYHNEWEFGKKYPATAWRVKYEEKYERKMMRYVNFYYEDKYTGKWITTYESTGDIESIRIEANELTQNPYGETSSDFFCSQTLFNTDDKYEYAFPRYTIVEEKEERDRDENGDIDYTRTDKHILYDGMDIISEDGSIVASFHFTRQAEEFDPYVLLWGDKTYVGFSLYVYNTEDGTSVWHELYSFERNSSQVTRVADGNTLMRMIPAMPSRNTSVTVELGKESVKNGGQLVVTDMNGRTVYRTPVSVGETKVIVPLHRTTSGVYNVTLINSGQQIENTKLIIK